MSILSTTWHKNYEEFIFTLPQKWKSSLRKTKLLFYSINLYSARYTWRRVMEMCAYVQWKLHHAMNPFWTVLVGVCSLPGRLGDSTIHIPTPVTGVGHFEQVLVLFKYLRWCTKTIKYLVIVEYCLTYWRKHVSQICSIIVFGGDMGQVRTQTHRYFEVFLLKLLNEGHLSQSLLVCFILHLAGHQYIIKCPLCRLYKDITTLNTYCTLFFC